MDRYLSEAVIKSLDIDLSHEIEVGFKIIDVLILRNNRIKLILQREDIKNLQVKIIKNGN